MKHKLSRSIAAAAAAALALTACASSTRSTSTPRTTASSAPAAFPVTLTSGASTVTLTKAPTHIVSLSATATEMLFAIGAGSQVKAVDKTSDYPASAPHSNLDAYQLNVESVAGYQPDLVVGAGFTAAQTKQFGQLHIPVLAEPAASDLTQTYAQIGQLGQATGHAGGATALIDQMKHQVAAIVAATPRPPAGTDYYYELDQTYYSVTTTTFVGQLLKLLGVTSIADAAKGAAASGRIPAVVRRIHPQGRPGLHLPGRHQMLWPVPRHRRQAGGLVDAVRGQR